MNGMPRLGQSRIAELNDALHAFEGMLNKIVRVAPYLPTVLSQRFLATSQVLDQRPQRRRVSVLFTDIVDFTGIGANLDAEAVAELLNEHFTQLVKCVERNAGNVDKFIGDAMMAYWSDENPEKPPALCAFQCALDIKAAIVRYNEGRARRDQAPIRVRIGLHTGPAIVGDIGGGGSVNHTLIGDTVNIAQRVEALGKAFMQPSEQSLLLVTRATVDELGQGLEAFSLGERLLPGSPTPVEVFRIA
jgi:class 3 adenylate cyclase